MATKQQLHDLIERLPENEIATVYRLLAGLLADPPWIASVTAPVDEVPYTPGQQADDTEAQAAGPETKVTFRKARLSARTDVRLVSGPKAVGVRRECSGFGLGLFGEAQRVRYELAVPTWEYVGVWITVQGARWVSRALKIGAIPLHP